MTVCYFGVVCRIDAVNGCLIRLFLELLMGVCIHLIPSDHNNDLETCTIWNLSFILSKINYLLKLRIVTHIRRHVLGS